MGPRIENGAGSRNLLDSVQGIFSASSLADGGKAFAQRLRDGGGQAFTCLSRELAGKLICLVAFNTQDHGVILPNFQQLRHQATLREAG